MTTCTVEDCDRDVYVKSRGWCSQHYNRWRLHGAPDAYVSRIYWNDEKRFWSKVEKSAECWLWTGWTVRGHYGNRYGVFDHGNGKRKTMAHRWAYEAVVGPIPKGLQIDHLCREPLCVRPDHLEPVTQAENVRRENAALGRDRGCFRCGCDKPMKCFGMCNMHFLRWKKAGRPPLD